MGLTPEEDHLSKTIRWQKDRLKEAEEHPVRYKLSPADSEQYEHMLNTLRREIHQSEHDGHTWRSFNERAYLGVKLKSEIAHLAEKLEIAAQEKSRESKPPAVSQLLYSATVPPRFRDAALGDREETFRKDTARLGLRSAVWLYRWDALVSLVAWTKKGISYATVAGLGGALMKWLGSSG